MFIHRASVEAANEFFTDRAPDAIAIADPDGKLFAAFDLQRGSLWQLFGPSVWWRGLRATLRGHLVGRARGNVWQMPGAFLLRGQDVVWQHYAKHAGDHPDLSQVLASPYLGNRLSGRFSSTHHSATPTSTAIRWC